MSPVAAGLDNRSRRISVGTARARMLGQTPGQVVAPTGDWYDGPCLGPSVDAVPRSWSESSD